MVKSEIISSLAVGVKGENMQKRFGLCQACLAEKDFEVAGLMDQGYLVAEDQLYTISHFSPKAKQIKCGSCGTLKSAAWGFTPVTIDSPEALSKNIRSFLETKRHLNWSFGHASLMELADWLERESYYISHNGRDYWVDAGVLYFFGWGDGFHMTLNAQGINFKQLIEMFLE